MLSRRELLGALTIPAVGALGAVLLPGRAAAVARELATDPGAPEELAGDEVFWREVQQAFTVDRSLVNLNNGGVSPAPAIVQEAMKGHLDYSNEAPPYTMWQVLEPQREGVRQRLARQFGCDAEEIALTRNASEGLQICQLGLDLEPGDEILTTTQDYPRMLNTFRQRERRDGIALRQIELPTPAENPAEVVALFERALTPRTRVILMCHVINLTGQILPVRDVVRMARRHDVPVIVDGAHSFAHFPFRHEDLECDYFATSLHKWLFAPHGTGLLYVRRDRIPGLWPLMAAAVEQDADIRKFEEIGTHPAANHLAIAEALTFHQGLGAERKLARLVWLRDRWARRLAEHDRVLLYTSLRPGFAGGIATVGFEGVDTTALAEHLWNAHRILVVAIDHPQIDGLRVSPSVYTTPEEIDRFTDAVERVLRDGLPGA